MKCLLSNVVEILSAYTPRNPIGIDGVADQVRLRRLQCRCRINQLHLMME